MSESEGMQEQRASVPPAERERIKGLIQAGRLTTEKPDLFLDVMVGAGKAAIEQLQRASRTRPDYDRRCTACSAPHWLDTSIPSEIWNQIAKDDELLCLLCIDERVARLLRTEREGMTASVAEAGTETEGRASFTTESEGSTSPNPRTETEEVEQKVLAEFYFVGQGIQSRGYLESHGEVQRLKRELTELRQDVEEWEYLAALMRERERPWIAVWQRETGQPDTLPDYGAMLAWLDERCRKTESEYVVRRTEPESTTPDVKHRTEHEGGSSTA